MKRRELVAVAILTAALCLSGCGGASMSSPNEAHSYASKEAGYAAAESSAGTYEYDDMMPEAAEMEEATADESYEADTGSGTGDSALRAQDGQKIVYTASLSIQSLEYEKSAASIRRKIKEAGGFSEAESEYDKDYNWYRYTDSSSDHTRSLSITARIPSDKFEAFLNSLDGDGKIILRRLRLHGERTPRARVPAGNE